MKNKTYFDTIQLYLRQLPFRSTKNSIMQHERSVYSNILIRAKYKFVVGNDGVLEKLDSARFSTSETPA